MGDVSVLNTPYNQRVNSFAVPRPYELWADGTYTVDRSLLPDDGSAGFPDLTKIPPLTRRPALTRVALSPIWIERLAEDEDGKHFLELCWDSPDTKRLWVPRLQVSCRHEFVKLSAEGLPITSDNTREFIAYLLAAIVENQGLLPSLILTSRSGAHDRGWLVGRTWVGDEPERDLTPASRRAQLSQALHTAGDLKVWMSKFEYVTSLGPLQRWLIMSSFAAPLLRMIGHRTFIIHHWGDSGTGKTAMQRFAASVWGNPIDLEQHFNRTEKSFGEIFRLITDLPVFFDERQAAGKDMDFATLIMTICLERGRGRLARDGQLQETVKNWRSIVRFTGEQPIIGNANIDLGGQSNRVLQLDAPVLTDLQARELNVWCESAGCYGVAGLAWLDYLRAWHGQLEELRTTREKVFKELSGLEVVPARIHHLSVIATAHMYFDLATGHGLSSENAVNDAKHVAGLMASERPSPFADRVTWFLKDHMSTHRHMYLDCNSAIDMARAKDGNHGQLVGFLNPSPESIVGWIPTAINKILHDAGYSSDRVWRDLGRKGMLKHDPGELTSKVRVAGDRPRLYLIKKL